jgi:hypothetical protein
MTERRRGTDGAQGEQGQRGQQGEQGIRGIPGFDGECCSGLVRLVERYKNAEAKIDREIIDREHRADINEKNIYREVQEREKEEGKIWHEISIVKKDIDKMKTMAITVMASSLLSILLFVGTIIAHLLKIGP